jgi:hypothetical protein
MMMMMMMVILLKYVTDVCFPIRIVSFCYLVFSGLLDEFFQLKGIYSVEYEKNTKKNLERE